jgi:hypothetical protein
VLLPNVPVNASTVIDATVQPTLRVIVPPPEEAFNVAVSAVEFGQPPAAAQVLGDPPDAFDHFVVSLMLPVPPTQKQAAAFAVPGARNASASAAMSATMQVRRRDRLSMVVSSISRTVGRYSGFSVCPG